MNKQNQTVIGIDIGSFTAKVAAVQRGAVDIITNQANFRQTPVVVGFGQGQRKIGEIGNAKLKSNFKNTVVSPIRYLGLGQNIQSVKKQLIYCPCETQIQGESVLFKVDVNGVKQALASEQVMAAFMTQLSQIVHHNNLDDKQMVIAVPSYFTEIEKKSLLNAAQISGAKNVKLITDAIAIGLDYATQKKNQLGQGRNVIFVDFGHSKLSLNLINFTDSKIDVLLQKYNRNLGCRDIDQKIFDYIAKKFEEKKGLNLKQNKKACLKLMEVIQRQRKILSGISESDISIECLMEDQDLSQSFTRQIMFNEANSVFSQILGLLRNFKQQVQKLNIKIDAIQLVGGGSRIPKFIEIVQLAFGMNASRTINSSQTIARGATLAAVQKSGIFRFQSFNIINRLPYQIKMSWKSASNAMNNQIESSSLNSQTIFQFNSVIPTEKTIKIKANKAQILISYDLLDQQIEKKIKTINYEVDSQQEKQISLTFNINQDGFVKIQRIQDNAGQDIKHSTKSYKILTVQQISKFKSKQRQMFVKDFAIIKGYEKKNELESFVYKQKQLTNNAQLKKYLSKQEIQEFQNTLQKIIEKLNDQDQQQTIENYQNMKAEIDTQIKKMNETIKQRKSKVESQLKKLQQLKSKAAQTLKQISQRFRKTNQVVQIYNQIKQIQDWAEQTIKLTKSKDISQVPVCSQKDIDQQHQNIKILINELVNPRRVQPQPQPRQYRSQPEEYLNHSNPNPRHYQNQHQQQRKKPQNQYYDPFGMSNSGFFRPNNMFGFF